MLSGTLYVVAGPIGNIADITYRAVEVLGNVQYILSEDTRETSKLLNKYDIKNTTQISYRDQNHLKQLPKILELLDLGNDIALVSDSGTPVISDPGFNLIRELRKQNITVKSIPGPSALTSALAISGLPTDRVVYLGFLPKKDSHRTKLLSAYGELDNTIVIYESPFRIKKLLEEVYSTLGDRYICFCREMTKMFEEVVSGYTYQLLNSNDITTKGEFVVLIAKKGYSNE